MSLSVLEAQTYKVNGVDAGFQQYHSKLLLIPADAFSDFEAQIKQESSSQQRLL